MQILQFDRSWQGQTEPGDNLTHIYLLGSRREENRYYNQNVLIQLQLLRALGCESCALIKYDMKLCNVFLSNWLMV